jgi:peroxiredoxin Q/BCP
MLKEGSLAPKFSLEADTGETVALKDLKGKTVIIYFYPKDMTSGCTQEACDFKDYHSKLDQKDVVILGVSKDSIESHKKFKEKYQLPFLLLSDPDGKVLEAYGVWKEKSMYGRKYMGIERTTVIISAAGKIVKVYSKVKVPGHVESVWNDLGFQAGTKSQAKQKAK